MEVKPQMQDSSIQQNAEVSPQEVARCARALAKRHGNRLMSVVAINSGLGFSYEDAVSKACEVDEDWACLVAELLFGLADASGLRDAIVRAIEAYFEEVEELAC